MRGEQWIFDLDFSKALKCSPSASLYSILLFNLGHYSLDGWTARCVRSWLTHQAPSLAVSGSCSALRLVTSRVLQRSILGLGPFSIFINGLEEMTEYALVKFGDDIKLGRPVDMPGGSVTIQRHLDSLEELSNEDLINSTNAKCKVMQLGWTNRCIGTGWRLPD